MVRVRFAPSPTGYLHVGGLRTALINYLFAKQKNGEIVLRIEDTDQARKVDGAVENLIKSLRWAGVSFDESPEKGSFGPYTQSERKDIYNQYITELLDKNNAYPCFCSEETLDKMRAEQKEKKLPIKYDGRCKSLSKSEVQQKQDAGEPFVIRMKIPSQQNIQFNDLIRGQVTISSEQLDDQVLLKSDGFPTYHLANVVDDHLMKISHVIRGEEWLSSTPKHILLYQYFGWETPSFAHISLLLNEDRSKLSKRQGDVAVEDYQKKGILPEALLNFIIMLGWTPKDEKEFMSLGEMLSEFQIEDLNKSGAVFDLEKLFWFNQHYIQKLSEEELFEFCENFIDQKHRQENSKEDLTKMLSVIQNRLVKFSDVNSHLSVFFQDLEKIEISEILKQETAKTVLESFLENIRALETLDEESFKSSIKKVQKERGIKGKDLWKPIRVAVTFLEEGPDLTKVAIILGKEKLVDRIEHHVRLLNN